MGSWSSVPLQTLGDCRAYTLGQAFCLRTGDIWGWVFFYCRFCPVCCCQMFLAAFLASIHWMQAASAHLPFPHQVMITQKDSRHYQMFPGRNNRPGLRNSAYELSHSRDEETGIALSSDSSSGTGRGLFLGGTSSLKCIGQA